MFDSNFLDVAIGLALFFLFVALMCSAVCEMIAALLRTRAADLERGIRNLFASADGSGGATLRDFFAHPRIAALFMGNYDADTMRNASPRALAPIAQRGKLPSYIPANQFATALIDIVAEGGRAARVTAVTGAELRSFVSTYGNPTVRRVVISALDAAQDDLEAAKADIEAWFNAAMDRVSGWYKQRTQITLFVIGALAAVLFNLDALSIGRQLQTSAALRAAAVAYADGLEIPELTAGAQETPDGAGAAPTEETPPTDVAAQQAAPPEGGAAPEKNDTPPATDPSATPESPESTPVSQRLDELVGEYGAIGYSTGWQQCEFAAEPGEERNAVLCTFNAVREEWAEHALGWLITALAVTLGAPFWFDVLSKFMSIRSAVKPRREPDTAESPAQTPAARAAPARAPASAATASVPANTDEPHEWADGHPQEGAI